MAGETFTRCPGCATVFRVTPAQLALREGQVRCGHCRAVFDANDHFVSLDLAPDEFEAPDELMMGRPTVTLRSADALQPVRTPPPAPAGPKAGADSETPRPDEPVAAGDVATAEESRVDESTGEGFAVDHAVADEDVADEGAPGEGAAGEGAAGEGTAGEGTADENPPVEGAPVEGTPDAGTAVEISAAEGAAVEAAPERSADQVVPAAVTPLGHAERFDWKKRSRNARAPKGLYVGAIVALAAGIALQALLEYRDTLAAHVPAMRPLLAAACRPFGCAIEPLRDPAALSIDASDLQADPAHRGLLLLTATIRNRAGHAIAYPYLELSLTDSADRVVVRRAIPPADYAGGTAEPRAGIPANGERVVKLFIDASATQQAGYRLYLFYP